MDDFDSGSAVGRRALSVPTFKLYRADCIGNPQNCRYPHTVPVGDEIQPVLDFLEDYGYIFQLPVPKSLTGRPPLPKYTVNQRIQQEYCHSVRASSEDCETKTEP